MWSACVGVCQLLNWKMQGETLKLIYNVFSAVWFTLHLMGARLQVNNSSNYNYELGISTPKRRTKSQVISRRQCILVAHISTFCVLICYLFHTLNRFVNFMVTPCINNAEPFYYQLMHIMLKNTELLKHSKIMLQHVSVYIETIFRELKSVLG